MDIGDFIKKHWCGFLIIIITISIINLVEIKFFNHTFSLWETSRTVMIAFVANLIFKKNNHENFINKNININMFNFIKKYYKSFLLYFIGIILLDFLYTKFFDDEFSLLRSFSLSVVCFLTSLTNPKK